MTTCISTFCSS